jgi:hypothetical protein
MASIVSLERRLRRLKSQLPPRPDHNARPALEVLFEKMAEISRQVAETGDVLSGDAPNNCSPAHVELAARMERLAAQSLVGEPAPVPKRPVPATHSTLSRTSFLTLRTANSTTC